MTVSVSLNLPILWLESAFYSTQFWKIIEYAALKYGELFRAPQNMLNSSLAHEQKPNEWKNKTKTHRLNCWNDCESPTDRSVPCVTSLKQHTRNTIEHIHTFPTQMLKPFEQQTHDRTDRQIVLCQMCSESFIGLPAYRLCAYGFRFMCVRACMPYIQCYPYICWHIGWIRRIRNLSEMWTAVLPANFWCDFCQKCKSFASNAKISTYMFSFFKCL